MSYSHSGYRYILGYGPDFFGIWERERSGGPVLTFPRTDEGWDKAWNTFVAWEPSHVEVPRAGVPADAGFHGKPYRSARRLARWTTGLVTATVAVAVLSAIAWALLFWVLVQFDAGQASSEALRVSAVGAAVSAVLFAVLLVASGIVWVVWQYRAHSNLRALGAADLRYTPGWAVGWWFIPFANIVMPYLTMRELWKASDPAAGAVDWKMARRTPLLPWWWGIWLTAQVAGNIVGSIPESPDISSETSIAVGFITFLVLETVAGVLAIGLIRGIDRRQEAKHQEIVERSRATSTTG